jgi:hypothetical protein
VNLDFLKLDAEQRTRAINEAAVRRAVDPVIMEKDFWVCWILDVLFQSSFADSLVFKGGTSLSKDFGAINRFSEDIDLSVSTEFLELPEPGDSRNQANKWMTNAEAACAEAARDKFLPELSQLIAEPLEPLKDQPDQQWLEFVVDAASNSPVILFHYPTTQPSGFEYLKRSVKLELGSLTEQRPIGKHPILPWLADEFPQVVPNWSCEVVALEIERSFWEKATILHAEHHRPEDSPTPDRYSRHYADTAALAQHPDGQIALELSDVRQRVVDWKARFFGSGWARYDLGVPGSFRLVPTNARMDALRRDYREMRDMYLAEPPSFDEVVAQLAELENRINAEWKP